MKRKRGHKKGKTKKVRLVEEAATETVTSPDNNEEENNSEENSSSEEEEEENETAKGEKEVVETPAPAAAPPERGARILNIRPDGLVERPPPTAVYGRVKVKLKASKPPVEQTPVQGGGGEGLVEKQQEGQGIKIVLSPKGGKESSGGGSGSGEEKKEKREEDEEVKKTPVMVAGKQGSRYDKHELETSLEVVKKIMKMDAAEPFNVPVNPIELGIPDYFDVIDTPMDFGTIRNNLENGTKYMNSEDVYRDVQYIWDNCYKYNNKGDYIVDLMKRVKKNFMKYWMAAGLYTEQSKKTIGGESITMDEATTSGHGKKLKRGKGVKRHKDDCMCAICIMKRRRREREAREAQEAREAGLLAGSPQTEGKKTGMSQEYKQEEHSHAESPGGDDTSSYLETSPDLDADAEMEDGEETRPEGIAHQYENEQKAEDDRLVFCDKSDRSGDISQKSQQNDKGETESYSHAEAQVQADLGSRIKIDAQKQMSVQPEGQTAGDLQQRHELLEMERKRQRLRLVETFRDLENPMLLGLCGTLFPNNRRSVWNGANSLMRCQRAYEKTGIHEAVASFMTPSCKSASSLK